MTESTIEAPLDGMLCFALYTAANSTVQAHRAVLAPWDLTYTQYLVLVLLASAPDGGLTMRDLGSRLSLDSGTLSPLVRRLEKRGLVERRRSSADERLVDVLLTEAGRAVHGELSTAIGCLTPAYGVSSVGELEALIGSLQRVATGMRAVSADARQTAS